MSNYTKTTDFAAKDSLPSGDADKIIRGAEFETEFDAISTAIATKADTAGPTFTGTLTFETISDGTISVTAFVDEDDMSSNSATLVPTQQSVKAYVDSQVTAQDLDVTTDSGTIAIDLDSETLTVSGGEGIDTSATGNAITIAAEEATASNKGVASFDSADFLVSSGAVSLATTSTAAELNILDGATLSTAELNLLDGVTATTAELNILDGVTSTATELNLLDGITGILDEDNMSSNSATALATQQSIKAYVDSQVTAQDLDVTSDSGTIAIDLDSEVMTIAGGEGIDTSATGNTVTIAGEDASTSNKGIASFDSADFSVTSGQVHLVTSAAAFGAVGNGSTDDTAALQSAMDSVAVSGAWLDGGNKTYLITTTIDVDQGAFCRMRNFKFKLGTSYSDQGRFNCDAGSGTTAMTIALDNIVLDGGRGDYKSGNEPWTDTTTDFGGFDTIEPSLSAFFKVNANNEETTTHITNCRFENHHGIAAVRVNSYGTTVIQGCVFKNISHQTFAVYQAVFDGSNNITAHKGRTIVSDVYAEDVGLLPATFNVDGSAMSFSSTTAAPQGSFNFLAIGGEYSISNAICKNYASCGVTADRNKKFNANNITVINDSTQSFSSNPSGAFWIESCEESNVTNLTVDVTARATIDTTGLDNSLLQIYLTNGNKAFFNNVFLKTDASTAYVNKFIRGSIKDTVHCTIENFYIEGTCRNLDDGVSFLMLPNSTIGHDIRLAHGYIDRGDIKIEQPFNVTIDDVYLKAAGGNGDVLLPVAGNSGISGTVESVSIVNSYINGAITNASAFTKSFNVSNNKRIGSISSAAAAFTAKAVVSDNAHIAGGVVFSNSGSTGASTVEIRGNGLIEGVTRVDGTNNAIVNGNNTERRITIEDVQHFQVVGNTAKTDAAEPCIYVNPTTPSNILSGVINGNSCLVKTGTSGAGFVSVASSVTNVMEGINNKLTVAWS